MEIDLYYTLIPLMVISFFASWLCAAAGGAGMINIPVLFYFGIPASSVIGTNKLIVASSTLASQFTHLKENIANLKKYRLFLLYALLGSVLGALINTQLPDDFIEIFVSVFVIIYAFIYLFDHKIKKILKNNAADMKQPQGSKFHMDLILGFIVGVYSGAISVGSGILCLIVSSTLLGLDSKQGVLFSRLFSFTINIFALFAFILANKVNYLVGLPMLATGMLGSYLGIRFWININPIYLKVTIVLITLMLSVLNTLHALG